VQALEERLGGLLRPVRQAYLRLSAEARILVGDAMEEFERRCRHTQRTLRASST